MFYCCRLGFPEMDRSAAAKSCKELALSLVDPGFLSWSMRCRGSLYSGERFIEICSRRAVGEMSREIPSAW